MAGVVTKCLNARPKTKQKGIDICMMYLEVEKQEAVQEEILKGLDNKQPKIVTGCVAFLRMAIRYSLYTLVIIYITHRI